MWFPLVLLFFPIKSRTKCRVQKQVSFGKHNVSEWSCLISFSRSLNSLENTYANASATAKKKQNNTDSSQGKYSWILESYGFPLLRRSSIILELFKLLWAQERPATLILTVTSGLRITRARQVYNRDTETGSWKFVLQLRTIRKMCQSQKFVTWDTGCRLLSHARSKYVLSKFLLLPLPQ